MQTIYKYTLSPTEEQTIPMPSPARVLSVDEQRGAVCAWALVDTDAALVPVRFRVHGTGHLVPLLDGWRFIGTVVLHAGALVLHVWTDDGARQ
ncbi:MAG: hypothetical protein WC789_10525 [Lentisphaeria bacterium]